MTAVGNPRGSGVCAPLGFRAGATAADIRGDGDDGRLDVAVVLSDIPALAAAIFTRNAVRAAPVTLSEQVLRDPELRAVVINSGNANACTGPQGMHDAEMMCTTTAAACGVDRTEVAVCSTGVIGRPLPMGRICAGIRAAVEGLDAGGGTAAARAIMTTDTVPKQASVGFSVEGRDYTVGGMIKGAGMIHPDMATLIGVLTTDAPMEGTLLRPLLHRAADATVNCVTVDGDTSTNDTLLLLANGAAGGDRFAAGSAALHHLEDAVHSLLDQLAEQLVTDAEGATKHFRVTVQGARSLTEARIAARTVAGSSLVKTAIHGSDPNWGRILAALGRSGAAMDVEHTRVGVGAVTVFEAGAPVAATEDAVRAVFTHPRIDIEVHLGAGDAVGHAWGCDLTADYVRINADYTT